jgi:dTDP-4-dehydrorhamnose reductase
MEILLIGAQGQVGQALQAQLPALGRVTALGRDQLDLTQVDQIRQVIQTAQPDVVVNAAAYTAVDRAEAEPDLAQAINAVAPQVMAATVKALGATLVHISTDYVFDGQACHPYAETHPTHPLGAYGRSKQQGEAAIQATGCQALILRTAWVYGSRGHGNFVKTMLRLGLEHPELRVVADQIGTPTWAVDIAGAICGLVSQLPTEPPAGTEIYHFTNSGVASWYDFAVAIFELAASLGWPLQVQRVLPITTADYPTPAQRPAYSVLANQKINAKLGAPAQHWRQALGKMLAELSVPDRTDP